MITGLFVNSVHYMAVNSLPSVAGSEHSGLAMPACLHSHPRLQGTVHDPNLFPLSHLRESRFSSLCNVNRRAALRSTNGWLVIHLPSASPLFFHISSVLETEPKTSHMLGSAGCSDPCLVLLSLMLCPHLPGKLSQVWLSLPPSQASSLDDVGSQAGGLNDT